MILGIAADLSAPPSSPSVFRDVTLYGCVFRHYEVVAYAEREMIDHYALWFRRYGLFDYVSEIVTREELGDLAIEIEGGRGSMLTAHNLNDVIRLLG